jgi:hypothetical protein
MGKISIVLDASKYDMFLLCPCRFDYRYNKNKTKPTKAPQLDRGQLVHLANEVYYQGLKDGGSYQDCVTAALSKVREAGVIESDLEPEEISRIVDVMEEYYDYWRVEDENLIIHEVEQPFLYLLHEDDEVKIHFSGKIDLVYSNSKDRQQPMDHKSLDRESELLRNSNQFKNYVTALKHNYLTVNRIGFQKTLKPHEKFKRPPLTYDPYILEDWKQNVVKNVYHYLMCAVENSWPMNETSCDKFHRRCEYYEVCDASGQEAKLYKLNTHFITVEPWDVTKVLRKSSKVLEDIKNASSETRSSSEASEVQDG